MSKKTSVERLEEAERAYEAMGARKEAKIQDKAKERAQNKAAQDCR